MNPLYNCPKVLAFLQDAKENPDDDTPRLILADWLEDQGDTNRAEFIRVQCRLASRIESDREALAYREEQLLQRCGGTWLGPLWSWRPTEYRSRRGLLTVHLNRSVEEPDYLEDVLPWIDSMHFEIQGWRILQRAVDILNQGTVNRVGFTLRRSLPEPVLLNLLGRVQESSTLRAFTFWCVRPAGRQRTGIQTNKTAVRPTHDFLTRLLRDLPIGRHLTCVKVGPGLTPEEAALIRSFGLEPSNALGLGWME